MTKVRVVVVTGAAGGIGLGVAQRFARDGYRVAMLDFQKDLLEHEANILRNGGAEVRSYVVNVAVADEVNIACNAIRDDLGPISIVIANAGIAKFVPFCSMTHDDWDEMIAVNLTGVFHTVKSALPDMIAANWGRIITISSQAAQSGAPNQVHYAASKGGVISMTKALAREFAAMGITANTIPPSLVETPLMHKSAKTAGFPVETIVSMIPIPRPGTPDDIAAACAYLASEDASYVTGQILGVNGGMYM